MSVDSAFKDTVELIRRAQAGERECIGHVLERYRERLLARVRWLMGARARRVADSGDFLHDVFCKVLERFDQFEMRNERSFLQWATRIARNGLLDDLDKKRETAFGALAQATGSWSVQDAEEVTPATAAEHAEQIAWLVDAVAELQESDQQLIELRHFEQLPFAEIGRRLGRSENAVQLQHARLLLQLHERLRGAS